jgi:MFS family permease
MQLVVPEILADARGLSMGIVIFGLAAGLFLWLFGWWSHRFWVVLTTTVLAGIYGLYEGTAFQAQPLAAALLLAVAAGVLALSLVRVLAFLAGGMAGLWAIQAAFPSVSQHALCFLAAGLVGLFLFRVWMMALTSLAGCLLAGYCGLTLLDRAGTMDAVEWTSHGAVLLNWLCVFLAVVGVLLQYLLDRRSRRKSDDDKGDEGDSEGWNPLKLKSLLDWQPYRRAG